MADQVEQLAALIRQADGSHELGASALAEALVRAGVRAHDQSPVCWKCKEEPGVVYNGDARECAECASKTLSSSLSDEFILT